MLEAAVFIYGRSPEDGVALIENKAREGRWEKGRKEAGGRVHLYKITIKCFQTTYRRVRSLISASAWPLYAVSLAEVADGQTNWNPTVTAALGESNSGSLIRCSNSNNRLGFLKVGLGSKSPLPPSSPGNETTCLLPLFVLCSKA
ncbi:hypothetical protein PoB_005713300 [Plakobranchus ocellatus]|uniref:Uncharacterized protein n=1 Tax=Plakobranchus ocellatus TaxID=259542 RepID=A0AAV4CHU2_9GAST|nr:hypothetical protein PoB_005713300 [Plakobranchus ocellatus]